MTDQAYTKWRRDVDHTCRRLQRIMRNSSRLDDATWRALLARIDSAVERHKQVFATTLYN